MKLSLLGHRIQYSLSPVLHKIIGDELGVAVGYELTDVSVDGLPQAVQRLKDDFDGFSVTKPFKGLMFPYVSADALSSRLGSVNTVKNSNGESTATNTDIGGFEYTLKNYGAFPLRKNERVLILGAGGAAVSAISVLMGHCDLYIHNRTRQKAVELINFLKAENSVKIASDSDLREGFDCVHNCTTLGLNGENCLPVLLNTEKPRAFTDMIYAPRYTVMLEKALSEGKTVVNGLAMLVEQGRLAWEFFTSKKIDKSITPKIIAMMEKKVYNN